MSFRLLADSTGKLLYLRDNLLVEAPDADSAPQVSIDAGSVAFTVNEGVSAIVRVNVDQARATAVQVAYTTVAGTALASTDYTPISGIATIAAGQTFIDLTIPTVNRAGVNGTRVLTLVLSNPVHVATDATATLGAAVATVSIVDVGAATVLPSVRVESLAAMPEGQTQTFRITLSQAHGTDITVDYATSPNTAIAVTDYSTVLGTRTIPAGQTTADVTVPTVLRVGYQGGRNFRLTISNAKAGAETLTILTTSALGYITDTETPVGSSANFDALCARTDFWKGYSMRPIPGRPKTFATGIHAGKTDPYYGLQLSPHPTGYRNGSSSQQMTYDPGTDTDPQAQDALKSASKTFAGLGQRVKSPITASGTVLHLEGSSIERARGILIDDEVMEPLYRESLQISDGAGGVYIDVVRGVMGSTPAAHAADARALLCGNSVYAASQMRFPLGTADGNTYYWQRDFYFTDGYLAAPFDYYKFDQNASGPDGDDNDGKIFWEMQTKFIVSTIYQPPTYDAATMVGVATMRKYGGITSEPDWTIANGGAASNYYARRGYGITKEDPCLPMVSGNTGGFLLHAGRWIRAHYFWKQTLNGWEHAAVWMSDEVTPARKIYDLPNLSCGKPGQIQNFWIEMNTSQQEFTRPWLLSQGALMDYASPAALPALVMYHRDLVALLNPGLTPADIEADPQLLQQPEP